MRTNDINNRRAAPRTETTLGEEKNTDEMYEARGE
jgi:hypothetical protein